MRSISLALILCLLASACGVLTGPESPEVRVEVQGTLFERDPDTGAAIVSFSVTNTGESTVYLNRCGDRLTTALDRWESGHWVQFRSDLCLTVYNMAPLPLAVEEERVGARSVHHAGRYRLRLGTSDEPGEPSVWLAASPAFTVE